MPARMQIESISSHIHYSGVAKIHMPFWIKAVDVFDCIQLAVLSFLTPISFALLFVEIDFSFKGLNDTITSSVRAQYH